MKRACCETGLSEVNNRVETLLASYCSRDLLTEAVQGAEAPDQVDGADPDNLTVREACGDSGEFFPFVNIVRGRGLQPDLQAMEFAELSGRLTPSKRIDSGIEWVQKWGILQIQTSL